MRLFLLFICLVAGESKSCVLPATPGHTFKSSPVFVQHTDEGNQTFATDRLQRDHPDTIRNSSVAEASIAEYKRMLLLVQRYPDQPVVPSPMVDLVWHAHILDTEQYARDSLRMFGRYLHHSPSYGGKEEKLSLLAQQGKMFESYQKEFECTSCVGCNSVSCGYMANAQNLRSRISPDQFSGIEPFGTAKPRPLPMKFAWTISGEYIYFQQSWGKAAWYGVGLNKVAGMGLADYMVSMYNDGHGNNNYTGVKDMYKYDSGNGYPCWDVLYECSVGNQTKGSYDLEDVVISRDPTGATSSSWSRKLLTPDAKDMHITDTYVNVLFAAGENDQFLFHGASQATSDRGGFTKGSDAVDVAAVPPTASEDGADGDEGEAEGGWYIKARHRLNRSNGGVALLLDRKWDAPEEIETGLEDVICVKVSAPHVGRTYHVIGVYIPQGSDASHAKDIFECIGRLCKELPNPVVLGDLNAHLPDQPEDFVTNRSAYPQHQHQTAEKTAPVATPRQMLTYVDTRYKPPRESLIDYVVLPIHLYNACSSVINNFHHNAYDNNSPGLVKTAHSLMCVTFYDDLVIGSERRPLKPANKEGEHGTKTIFTDPYELPMHKHVRENYAEVSDSLIDEWRYGPFNEASQKAKTDAQEAVTEATESFANAVLCAAHKGLQTKQVAKKQKRDSRRLKPGYWSKEIQVLSDLARYARHDLVTALRSYSDSDDITELRREVREANNNLYTAIQTAQAKHARTAAEQIESDLAHA
eukprot:g1468.t1